MQIKKIKKTNSKVILTLDNSKLEIFPSIYASYKLFPNKIIDEEELNKIKEDNKIEEFFLFIVKRLILTTYSPNKIEEILIKKGAKKQEIKKVIEKLRKYDFINEERIIEDIISYCDNKHYGYFRIIKMLKDRKISSKLIEKIEYNSSREVKQGNLLIKKIQNLYKNKNDFSRKKSIYSAMIRHGFSEDVSLELVNKISNSNHIHEINVLKLDYEKYFFKYSKKYVGYELNHKITNALLSKGYRMNDINYVKETRK